MFLVYPLWVGTGLASSTAVNHVKYKLHEIGLEKPFYFLFQWPFLCSLQRWPLALPASPFLFSPVPHSSPWSLVLNHRSTNLSFKGWLLVLLLWCYFPQKHLHFNRTHLQTEKSKEIKLNSRIIGK